MTPSSPHSELRRAIEETRKRYGFPDIEKRYPAAMLDTFFLKDAIALLEQYESVKKQANELLQDLSDTSHAKRELQEQLESAREAVRKGLIFAEACESWPSTPSEKEHYRQEVASMRAVLNPASEPEGE